jgi:tetratricopeptide (TPR) repeat protein
MKKIKKIVKNLQEFWFLITLIFSTIITLLYMLIFQVKPWDTYAQIRRSREQECFHYKISCDLLEKGHYKKSKEEFEKVLAINPNNLKAVNGLYFSNLFLEIGSPNWDPAVGLEVQSHLKTLGISRDEHLEHVVEKYLGDLHYRIGEINPTILHYEKALQLKPDYIDALCSYGWLTYWEFSDANKMQIYFDRIIKADSYDYRGYHGSGYALYMKALSSNDRDTRIKYLQDASKLSLRASRLIIYYVYILMDFGEISRALYPLAALDFHNEALNILENNDLNNLEPNKASLNITLLKTNPGYKIYLDDIETKKSWIYYQIALDYYSMYKNKLLDLKEYEKKFKEYYSIAKSLDKKKKATLIYDDQKIILDYLLD